MFWHGYTTRGVSDTRVNVDHYKVLMCTASQLGGDVPSELQKLHSLDIDNFHKTLPVSQMHHCGITYYNIIEITDNMQQLSNTYII